MGKIHNHDDAKIDAEMDNIYSTMPDYRVTATTPVRPREGTIWFNPDTGVLKFFRNTRSGWQTI
ncbi:MAG: hypothetical protein AAB456_03360 [Patescibacteria group bacterium]